MNTEGLAPLSLQEHLLTRAAIPYRAPTLNASAAAIRQRRQQEQAGSDLVQRRAGASGGCPRMKKHRQLDRL
ncbi:MAG: hypothetical protein KME14_12750 [Tildeniella torsiva UHER 1998/13D]|nr:hypothetical protein [Tildeniella torsiva UHER 1998/13D]